MNASEANFDMDLERAILSSCIFNENVFEDISIDIDETDFAYKAHQDIFKALLACSNANEPKTSPFLKKHNKNIDENALNEILTTNSLVDIHKYTQELKEKSIKRKLLSFAHTIPSKINENKPVSQISDELSKDIFAITSGVNKADIKDIKQILAETILDFKKQKEAKDKEILGLDTGFKELNKKTKGFKGGDLIIVAARPGMGKTTICLNFIQTALKHDKGVVFFSLEMPATQIMQRFLSSRTSIPLSRMLIADLNDEEWSRVTDVCTELEDKKFYIYDSGYANIQNIRSVLRRLKSQNQEIELCVIDYIGLMMSDSKFSDRHLQVSEISRGLKLLARELNIPIIALSQLNRGLESRANKRPMLSDLRESGAIEQDADTILFVYRDEIYREQEEKERENKAKAEGKEYQRKFMPNNFQEQAELIIGKNRNGPTGTVDMIFFKESSNFTEAQKSDFVATNFEE